VRRVVLILFVLVLTPSIATASWYRCAYDGTTRSACCCPADAHRHEHKAPDTNPSVRAACCCTVTQVTTTAPTCGSIQSTSFDIQPPPTVVAFEIAPVRAPVEIVSVDRPRAQGDPPDTLLARRCSLLL
jgi:hypothetical protein